VNDDRCFGILSSATVDPDRVTVEFSDEGGCPMEPRPDSPVRARSLAARLHINQRSLQLVLGVVWIIDGLLKFQPNVLKSEFLPTFIRQMAAGQPTLVSSALDHMANFVSHEATMWVVVIGLIEIGIGVGLLFQRSLKPALVASFVWGIGVYIFGEGFGMVLTGHTSPLQSAPGAVCFYVLLGLMLWPRSEQSTEGAVGAESSAAAHGLLGGTGSLLLWAAIWVFEAIIWMFPFNRTGSAISSQMADTAQGEPGWYAHLLNSFGHAFVGAGIWMAVILAVISLVIALGPLVSNRPQVFIGLGIALALAYWVTGEGLGSLLTGGGTDPSNGPIVALIGLSILPLVAARADEPTPAARLLATKPQAAVLSALALVLVPLVAAVVPTSYDTVAATAPASSGGSSGGSSVKVVSTSGSTQGTSGSMNGMSMTSKAGSAGHGASQSMNMSAMAGLNVTDSHWKYTGPPIPAAEVNELTAVSNEEDKGHKMQTPDCTAQPTSQQVLGATQYVQATSAAVSKYKDLSTALAAGYFPITSTRYPVVHYLNIHYMNQQDLLNPNTVDSLVYATTPYGPVLVAAMYLMPGQGNGPMPYGCLVQWHAHTNLCSSDTGQIDGLQPCAAGSRPDPTTPYMTHVWQVPVAGGPLAIDPSDLQVVEAAVMAQQQGLAPTTTGTPPT
jgi:hypothetical protein